MEAGTQLIKSWKWAINYLNIHKISDKVTWMGRLQESDYVEWLKNSDCHAYLTHPYVTSWSFIEALHCCRNIVASYIELVEEFNTRQGIILVDHRNISNTA